MDEALTIFYEEHRVVRPLTPDGTGPVRLVCFDMDGVLIDAGSSWVLVHKHFGVENKAGLEAYLRGEFDDEEFVRRDVALWRGVNPELHRRDLEAIFETPPFMPGVEETVRALREAGVEMCICSGGIDLMAERVAHLLGIHHVAANGFKYDEGGFLTGEGVVRVPLNDKAAAPVRFGQELGIPLEECVSIGNSMPDASMFDVTGRSIAFHPEDQYTRDHATWTIESGPLTQVLPLLLPLAPKQV